MRLAEIKQLASEVEKMTAKARATGPRTEQGKVRSALNATKHGLSGKHLLLQGEDRDEYERRMDAVFEALHPADEAQAQIVALIGDDLWKLERLGKIEQGTTLGRIEELLGHTPTAGVAAVTTNAIAELGTALEAWAREPIPSERSLEFSRRLKMMMNALEFVADTAPEVPSDCMKACEPFLTTLLNDGGKAVATDAYTGLYVAARGVMKKLFESGERIEAAQENLRKSLATIALPDETELKKLGRYRKMLEEGLQRRLAALDQLRKLSVAASEKNEHAQAAAREYRLRLRVVA